MEGFGFSDASSAVRKRRSNTSRRPRNDSLTPDYQDMSSLSSTPPSESNEPDLNTMKPEEGGFGESDEASNNCSFRGSNEQRHSVVDSTRCSEGVLAPANWRNTSSVGQLGAVSGVGNENKVKKVKLKVGGITRTINTKSTSDGASAVGSSCTRSSRLPDAQQKSIEEIVDDNRSFTSDKGSTLRGVPWKDFSRSGLNVQKADNLNDRVSDENLSSKQIDKYEPVRKSKRVPKRRLLDGVLDDEGEDDDEIRYLEKIKTSKMAADYVPEFEDEDEAKGRKQRKISRVMKRNINVLYDADVGGHGKKSKSGRVSDDTDYFEEEELGSDGEPTTTRKKVRKELVDLMGDSKKEMTVTTRQRALQSGRDVSSNPGTSVIEFPNGLPPAPPKKQKEKLTEVEQQLKRAEALQKRRMQVEKAARESEAEAIRKILGQDSTRKKRDDKWKKHLEELAQGRAANALVLTDHVRWVMGPSGTVVTFPNEIGLPSIFDPKPSSYPPPREKCVGPLCSNPYKYRDSKSKLPLCSLECYKAIQA